MRSFLKTITVYTLWLIITLCFLPWCILLALLPKKIRYKNPLYFFLTSCWNCLLVKVAGVLVVRRGEHYFSNATSVPAIVVMNHTSSFDIPLVEDVLGSSRHIWMSHKRYGHIPFFGILLKQMHVLVDKNDSRAAAHALIKAYSCARENQSHIIIFPEGTRSRTGRLGPFLPGFVMLARKLRWPVVPIAIKGAHAYMPVNGWLLPPLCPPITLVMGKPFHYDAQEGDEEFLRRLHSWFEDQLS